nr:hypothetical protein [Tanacetum cinerariifolium]
MLASLQRITYPNYEIIIVDNASNTEELISITTRFSNTHLIRSTDNLGFAGGNNLGIAAAHGKYILFLNNDTEVLPGILEPLVDLFESTSNVDEGQYNTSTTTGLVHGAAMMVPMQVIREVGLMPEVYFLYYEELDWCEMIKRAGYSCYYVADSTVYHKESASVGQGSVMRTYYMYRNRLLYIRRNLNGIRFWSGAFFFLFIAIPKQGLVFASRLKYNYLQALWRGIFLLLNVLYLLFFAVAGHLKTARWPVTNATADFQRMCVLIPAYHADEVILETAPAAQQHSYLGQSQVYVIADGLKSGSVEKLRSQGIKVIEVQFEKSTKGKALLAALKAIPTDLYDVAVVLDVDNIMASNFLDKVNSAFAVGYRVVQGHRTAKNLDSAFAVLDACNEEINNHIFRQGHASLGMSAALIGSGMAFEYKYFQELLQD